MANGNEHKNQKSYGVNNQITVLLRSLIFTQNQYF